MGHYSLTTGEHTYYLKSGRSSDPFDKGEQYPEDTRLRDSHVKRLLPSDAPPHQTA